MVPDQQQVGHSFRDLDLSSPLCEFDTGDAHHFFVFVSQHHLTPRSKTWPNISVDCARLPIKRATNLLMYQKLWTDLQRNVTWLPGFVVGTFAGIGASHQRYHSRRKRTCAA